MEVYPPGQDMAGSREGQAGNRVKRKEIAQMGFIQQPTRGSFIRMSHILLIRIKAYITYVATMSRPLSGDPHPA